MRSPQSQLEPASWLHATRCSGFSLLHTNPLLAQAISDIRTLLRESVANPTHCRELTTGWPDYIGCTDASRFGFGGIIIGEGLPCIPTVVQYEWPRDIQDSLLTKENPKGKITNSDLEMAGLTLLYLVMGDVCPNLKETRIALFSDNSPTISWVDRLASKHSVVSGQLVRAIALQLKLNRCCPLTPLHVPGTRNIMADIPSRSFGSNAQWHCKTNDSRPRIRGPSTPHPSQFVRE